ncbi:hypothetical protein [Lentibacillus amyloliquefaciens]|uniref:Uncharacterized protein n=1 Tax=Lentibacillus amyloliquefaciens TaxID=1472767 RepID=A0A0U3WBL8_9BACI|nr:hypothetical protein [Lentibacillus amyloliquefaciens]ALX47199.1 hypothetical protein AOX59_00440 [Lentibacillus amyloliquefaciens]
MSKSEKRWRRFYLILMIFIYAIYVPVTVTEWLAGTGSFPITAIVVGVGLPLGRINHLRVIREKEEKNAS